MIMDTEQSNLIQKTAEDSDGLFPQTDNRISDGSSLPAHIRQAAPVILELLQEEAIADNLSRPQPYGFLQPQESRNAELVLFADDTYLFYEPRQLLEQFLYNTSQLKIQYQKVCQDAFEKKFGSGAGKPMLSASGGGKMGWTAGTETEDAKLSRTDSIDYHRFLYRFCVSREEAVLDMNSFDYIPYLYGLEHYQNMPFLEPLEYSEVNRLDELAIAIDTSGSCSGTLVRRFLEETWSILRQKENFFSRMRLHLIQCDSMIQEYRIFTNTKEWEAALPTLKILGHGNTDFRPVFELLTNQIRAGEIRSLRALLYFTDGDGIFPRTAPPFKTAFVFLNQESEKGKTPAWAIRLNLNLKI